jgi:hypothetical protein
MSFQDSVDKLNDTLLCRTLSTFSTIEDVLSWIKGFNPRLDGLDVIQQDEFTFDLVVPQENQFLAFGST